MSDDASPQRSPTFSGILLILLFLEVAVISISVAAASVLFAAMLLCMFVWSAVERRWILPGTVLDRYILAYITVEIVTAVFALHRPEALYNAKRLLLIAVTYGTVLAFDRPRRIRDAVLVLSLSVGALSIVEIVHFFAAHLDRLMMFQSYMTAGGIKMIVLLFALPFLLHPATPRRDRWLLACSLVPIGLALLLTDTRSSWLGGIAGVGLYGILRNRRVLIALGAVIVLFFILAPEKQIDRARSIVDPTHVNNVGRLHMWSTGLKIFADHPLLGVGDSDLHEIYVQYKAPDDQETGGHLHDNLIMLLVTLGVVGCAIVCALFVAIARMEYRTAAAGKADWILGSAGVGALLAFCGFQVNGLFEWNFGDHEIMVLFWFTTGLALAAWRQLNGASA